VPAGARAAGRVDRFLACVGRIGLLCSCMLLCFAMCGTKFDEIANGDTACSMPEIIGGPGVRVVGDSALRNLAAAMPRRLNGSRVTVDVKAGRTAQQGENAIGRVPDAAPSVFVVSFERDDRGSERVVYWIIIPGEEARNKIVEKAASDPSGGGWYIVDFAASVRDHPQACVLPPPAFGNSPQLLGHARRRKNACHWRPVAARSISGRRNRRAGAE
jgi:uncharacterized protein Veg